MAFSNPTVLISFVLNRLVFSIIIILYQLVQHCHLWSNSKVCYNVNCTWISISCYVKIRKTCPLNEFFDEFFGRLIIISQIDL